MTGRDTKGQRKKRRIYNKKKDKNPKFARGPKGKGDTPPR